MALNKRKTPEVRADSQADIAFLLLIFFLVATTMNTDKGISRVLPPIPPEDVKVEDIKQKERNVLLVFVNGAGQLMVADEMIDIRQLKDRAKEFILNVNDDENMPEKEDREIDMPDGSKWIYKASKGIISLQTTRDTNYEIYIQVQNELTRVFNEIREDVSMQKFGKPLADLTEDERKVITTAVQQKISEAEPRKAIKK
ncbi:MAG: biopolymer transporter ExbD [Alistipes sp.]|nr:biopolymer transporter ExbD [Alistipes sp.]